MVAHHNLPDRELRESAALSLGRLGACILNTARYFLS